MTPNNKNAQQAHAALKAAASGSEQDLGQLSRSMASLVSTRVKSVAAFAVLQQEQQQLSKQPLLAQLLAAAKGPRAAFDAPLEPADGKLWPELAAVATAAGACCKLGTMLIEHKPALLAASKKDSNNSNCGTSSTSRVSSNASCSSASTANPAKDWVVLAAKCMLHLGTWMLQQPGQAVIKAAFSSLYSLAADRSSSGGLSGVMGPCAKALLLDQRHGAAQGGLLLQFPVHTSPLVLLLHSAVCTVRWLREQLQAAAGSSLSGGTGQQQAAAKQLSMRAQVTAKALELQTSCRRLSATMPAARQ